MTMKFYMAPGSCSTGIHIILEKLELLFEAHLVNIPKGQNKSPEYLHINPKGTIPALVLDDGFKLTEFQSIAYFLATNYPKSSLLSQEPKLAGKTIETMAYVVNTIHGQGFARIFAPDSFAINGVEEKAIQSKGQEIVDTGFRLLNDDLKQTDSRENSFTIADAALFYVEFWADKLSIELPENLAKHYENLLADNVVSRVLMEEGYH